MKDFDVQKEIAAVFLADWADKFRDLRYFFDNPPLELDNDTLLEYGLNAIASAAAFVFSHEGLHSRHVDLLVYLEMKLKASILLLAGLSGYDGEDLSIAVFYVAISDQIPTVLALIREFEADLSEDQSV